MASTYMSVDDRSAIADDIVAHKYDRLESELRLKGCQLAQRLYERRYAAEERTELETAPEGKFREAYGVMAEVNGQSLYISFSGVTSNGYDQNPVTKRVWSRDRGGVWFKGHDDDPQLAELASINSEAQRLRTERREQKKIVQKTLETWRYFEKAIADWPEAADFIRARANKKSTFVADNLPAVQLQDLNRVLELPPGDA